MNTFQSITYFFKFWLSKIRFRFWVIFAVILICIIFVGIAGGLQPCGWLDRYLENSRCIYQLDIDDTVFNMVFTPDGSTLITRSASDSVDLWHFGETITSDTLVQDGGVYGIALTPDGAILVVSFRDYVQLWQVSNGTLLQTLDAKPNMARIAVSPDGKFLASADPLRLWHIDNEELNMLFNLLPPSYTSDIDLARGYAVNGVAFSSDGSMLASGGKDDVVRLWQVSDGILLDTLQGHLGAIESVAFSPSDDIVASAGQDKTIRLWKASDGQLLNFLEGHTDGILSIAFSPVFF